MPSNPFQELQPNIQGNQRLRTPQREAYEALATFATQDNGLDREIGIILPVGCGKSGCITLAPFAFRSRRVLVVAPGLTIARQLHGDFDPAAPAMFYTKTAVLTTGPYPEPAEIRGTTTNRADLEEAHVVITNIQQLQGSDNRWLQQLPPEFFDLILFDEGHHSVAASWELLRERFPKARIVNFSATPLRADGQLMAGQVVYSYPVARAIEEGYVKRLKGIVLNPQTLRFVRRDEGTEVTVDLDEVRRLGDEDAGFRRSIVTSAETLSTIADASIRELYKLRQETGEQRLKIIASALNFAHCAQIVAAYKERGLRAGYVHSREDGAANERVLAKLANHELDVIVQVRKLGEGFDHPFLAVAAVFSIFRNLSPFVQFVGRIMRVIHHDAPGAAVNQGVVVFHAGGNVARRWEDFREYSQADQEYFDQLLPLEDLDFSTAAELLLEPRASRHPLHPVDIRSQTDVRLEEIPLIGDRAALAALRLLKDRGYSTSEVSDAYEKLEPLAVTKVRRRQAMRSQLDARIRTEAGRVLHEHARNPEGRDLDRKRLGRSNLVVMKSAIDREVNAAIGRGARQRHEFTRQELDKIERSFPELVTEAVRKVFNE